MSKIQLDENAQNTFKNLEQWYIRNEKQNQNELYGKLRSAEGLVGPEFFGFNSKEKQQALFHTDDYNELKLLTASFPTSNPNDTYFLFSQYEILSDKRHKLAFVNSCIENFDDVCEKIGWEKGVDDAEKNKLLKGIERYGEKLDEDIRKQQRSLTTALCKLPFCRQNNFQASMLEENRRANMPFNKDVMEFREELSNRRSQNLQKAFSDSFAYDIDTSALASAGEQKWDNYTYSTEKPQHEATPQTQEQVQMQEKIQEQLRKQEQVPMKEKFKEYLQKQRDEITLNDLRNSQSSRPKSLEDTVSDWFFAIIEFGISIIDAIVDGIEGLTKPRVEPVAKPNKHEKPMEMPAADGDLSNKSSEIITDIVAIDKKPGRSM
jgi:hypothetical protein